MLGLLLHFRKQTHISFLIPLLYQTIHQWVTSIYTIKSNIKLNLWSSKKLALQLEKKIHDKEGQHIVENGIKQKLLQYHFVIDRYPIT